MQELVTKESWTMKLLVKHYPVINQWMKLMNGKQIRFVQLPCANECWLGTGSKNHSNHTFPSEARIPPNSPTYNQLTSKDYQCKHKPSDN